MRYMNMYFYVINFANINTRINILLLNFSQCRLKRDCKQFAYACHGRYVFYIITAADD